jgi:hypothetical protein
MSIEFVEIVLGPPACNLYRAIVGTAHTAPSLGLGIPDSTKTYSSYFVIIRKIANI